MRIISQNGKFDLTYEDTVIHTEYFKTEPRMVVAIFKGEKYTLGTYSTEEKAIKAMEMLRERHTDNVFCREDIQYKAEIMLDEGLNIVREMMMKCEYFQFPKDDEVKV